MIETVFFGMEAEVCEVLGYFTVFAGYMEEYTVLRFTVLLEEGEEVLCITVCAEYVCKGGVFCYFCGCIADCIDGYITVCVVTSKCVYAIDTGKN